MSRLYDRVVAEGCRALTAQHVMRAVVDPEALREGSVSALQRDLGRPPTDEEVNTRLALGRAAMQQNQSAEEYLPSEFESAVSCCERAACGA